jgi:hypothetical protein
MGLRGKAPFEKGRAILAKWLVAMWEAIQANEVTVDPSSGLTMLATPSGKKLGLVAPGLRVRYATITTACPGFGSTAAGGANKYGMGAGTLDSETYDPSTRKGTRVAGSGSVDIHNGGIESVPAGRRVIVIELSPGRWHILVNFCPT